MVSPLTILSSSESCLSVIHKNSSCQDNQPQGLFIVVAIFNPGYQIPK